MSLWGSIDQANNAPKYKITAKSPNTGIQLYGTQVVGIDDGEMQAGKNSAHSGWVRVKRGTGPVLSITVSAPGTGYTNTDTVKVSGGTVNAAGTIVTNGTGNIASVTVSTQGSGFTNVSSSTVTITTGAGTGGTLVPVLGGRSGRVQTEVLVTQSNMTANGSSL